MSTPKIHWYPGHIAKAEKQLSNSLDKVDLVIEIRDARIPLATSHPHLDRWINGKQHLIVINRKDMITAKAKASWDEWFKAKGDVILWSDGKSGKGIKEVLSAAINKGKEINERRKSRGMLSRPIRALTLGFPNVGKSALINRLVQKKVVESARRAGVTRHLKWVRLGQSIDLLDAPGVLPPRLDDQEAALRLAICDDIGQAAYQVEQVAIAFLEMLQELEKNPRSGVDTKILEKRYGILIQEKTKQYSYTFLAKVAEKHTSGNTERMAQRLLDDFRKSLLGFISLELPK